MHDHIIPNCTFYCCFFMFLIVAKVPKELGNLATPFLLQREKKYITYLCYVHMCNVMVFQRHASSF